MKPSLVRALLALSLFAGAAQAADIIIPWQVRADADPACKPAVPEVVRWCLPDTESSLPLRNAVHAQQALLSLGNHLNAAWVVVPSRTMTEAQWNAFIAQVAWAKADAETYATTFDPAKFPTQTLADMNALVLKGQNCTGGGDPTLQAKLDKALADNKTVTAALAKAQADLKTLTDKVAAASTQLAALTKDKADLTAALTKAQADVLAANKARDDAVALSATHRAQRDWEKSRADTAEAGLKSTEEALATAKKAAEEANVCIVTGQKELASAIEERDAALAALAPSKNLLLQLKALLSPVE
jgi:hypothetical protein